MSISMQSYISAQNAYWNSGISQMSQIFDFKAAQQQTQQLLNTYKTNNATVQSLKKDSADFLKQYTSGMNNLNSAAGKLTNGGMDKLLYNKEGNVTEDTVKNTVSAVRSMVEEYNSNLKTLNDNAERGEGVTRQMARMVDDPAPAASMKMVGVSVNKDGTLALDEEKLTEALSTENADQRKLVSDIIGGSTGIAAGVQKDARAGLNTSAQSLINNDLAEMQSIRSEDPIRSMAQSLRGAGAYALNNQAAMGILMNMMV